MSKQNLTLTVLSLSALALVLANYILTPAAMGDIAMKDRQYQVCTAITPSGDEALYVLNNQTGMLSVYSYDSSGRRIVSRAIQPVMDLFSAAPLPSR